jgi:hypothetical protein
MRTMMTLEAKETTWRIACRAAGKEVERRAE